MAKNYPAILKRGPFLEPVCSHGPNTCSCMLEQQISCAKEGFHPSSADGLKNGDFDVLFDFAHQHQTLVHFTESYLRILPFPAEGVNESGSQMVVQLSG